MNEVMYSSKTDDWATPQEFYDILNKEFLFNLDPCASEKNHKCEKFITKEQDGLACDWGDARVFCNPPYGKEVSKWVEKYSKQMLAVMLLPARTDTRWFHDFIYLKAEVRFIKGRLKFGDGKAPAPFPSMIVIFRNFSNKQLSFL